MMRCAWYTSTATLATSEIADTVNRAAGLCEECTEKTELVTKAGTAIVNIIQSARVAARCCSQAPFFKKNAGIVHEMSSAAPA